jgi:hypothetical protein
MTGADLEGGRRRVPPWLGALALAVVTAAVLDLYAVRFVAAERTLYHADQLAYWSFSRGLTEAMMRSPLSALGAVSESVAHAELNLLPAVPVSAAMTVLGGSRTGYVVAILTVYGPAVVLALWAALAATRDPRSPTTIPMAVTGLAAALLLLPSLWYPVFIGYLGLGGVAIGLLILALYLRRPAAHISTRELLLIGFLLALLALFRRWYGIWSIAFWAIVTLESAVGAWRSRGLGRAAVASAVRPAAVVTAAAAATALLLAAPLLAQRLTGGYTEEFVAYGASSLMQRVGAVITEFGLTTLAFAGIALGVLVKRPAYRRSAAVIGGHLVVVFLVMSSLQAHDPQHWYLYSAGLLLLVGTWSVAVLGSDSRSRRRLAAALLLGVGLVTTVSVLVPTAGTAAGHLGPLVPGLRVRPKVRTDLDQVRGLLGRLDAEVRRRPGYIYVLGSSSVLSDQVLAFANLSLGSEFLSPSAVLSSAHVDRRDGFPRMLLEATYVVVAEPVQAHLGVDQQQVVVVPATSFLESRGIAAAFRRLPGEYHLDDDVTVSLFERVRPIRDDELAEMSDRLRASYPDRPDIYGP